MRINLRILKSILRIWKSRNSKIFITKWTPKHYFVSSILSVTSYAQLTCASNSIPNASLTSSYCDKSCKNEKHNDEIENRDKKSINLLIGIATKIVKYYCWDWNYAAFRKRWKFECFQFNGKDWLNEFILSIEVEAWIFVIKTPRVS